LEGSAPPSPASEAPPGCEGASGAGGDGDDDEGQPDHIGKALSLDSGVELAQRFGGQQQHLGGQHPSQPPPESGPSSGPRSHSASITRITTPRRGSLATNAAAACVMGLSQKRVSYEHPAKVNGTHPNGHGPALALSVGSDKARAASGSSSDSDAECDEMAELPTAASCGQRSDRSGSHERRPSHERPTTPCIDDLASVVAESSTSAPTNAAVLMVAPPGSRPSGIVHHGQGVDEMPERWMDERIPRDLWVELGLDVAPFCVQAEAPMHLVHFYFSQLTLNAVFVVDKGRFVGMINKVDMIKGVM